jgi:hypothetical protein
MTQGLASFICPKRKCRHQWSQFFENAVQSSDCPACGAKDIAAVWIETEHREPAS